MSALTAFSYGIERAFCENIISDLKTRISAHARNHSAEKTFFPACALFTAVQTIDLSDKAAKLLKVGTLFPKISKSLFSQITNTYLITQAILDAITVYGEGILSRDLITIVGNVSSALHSCRPIANAICVIASMNFPLIAGYFLHLALMKASVNADLRLAFVSVSYAIAAASMIMHGGFVSRLIPAKF
ncbi:MAG: hypothetical protein COT84_04820 [Chlamydiae bacterium CG10_big_fil_rev_8_21_14_0_10_35_9]|nr:MAG: hypothetical protein COT84_04820 [Chlamydiae bacterium CG10_big_fil_rev_8_21_14_0_10_35_9]